MDALQLAQGAATVVGVYTLACICINVGGFVYRQFLRPGKNLKKYGAWAVVTGATDGIGKAYAEALAKKGLNVLAISRTEEKLQTTCTELKEKYSVDADYVVADLCAPTEATWKAISDAVGKVEAGILINNAGMSYDHPEYLELLSEEKIQSLVTINCTSLTQMCRIALPGMKERKKGAIVNISSAASFGCVAGNPLLAGYAATKAYVEKLSVSLAAEAAQFNVSVQVQPPYFVTSKLSKIRRSSFTVPTPKAYVADAIKCIGYGAIEVPYFGHAIVYGALKSLPAFIATPQILSMHKGLRKRAYKKKEKAQ